MMPVVRIGSSREPKSSAVLSAAFSDLWRDLHPPKDFPQEYSNFEASNKPRRKGKPGPACLARNKCALCARMPSGDPLEPFLINKMQKRPNKESIACRRSRPVDPKMA
jgi:hypothetical protein